MVTRIALIGAPSSAGAYAPGQELAPQALRDAGLARRLAEYGLQTSDRGDLPIRRPGTDPGLPRARNLDGVLANLQGVRDEVTAARDDGDFPLVLGGDCTTGLGTVAAIGGPVVYLDLHADMNTPDSVVDGAFDRMGLGHALDLPGAVPRLAQACPLTPADVVLCGLGVPYATEFERDHIERLGLSVITDDELAADPAAAATRALDLITGDRPIALHFDVGLVDFGDVPLSESTDAGRGVSFDQATATLAALLADPRIAALTITEHNPLHGAPDGSDSSRLVGGLATALGGRA